jgi:hypothetical protein
VIVEAEMLASVRELFDRYERSFASALRGEVDMDEVASFYATSFVAATPAGVMAGANDDRLRDAMQHGYARYRAIGTKAMRIRAVPVSPIDDLHCIAHVAWTATYARKDADDVSIDFDVHYLVQVRDGEPRIFGWISGDEQAVLEAHGIG